SHHARCRAEEDLRVEDGLLGRRPPGLVLRADDYSNALRDSLHRWWPLRDRYVTAGQRLAEIRTGFERPFWIANITEIFERLSYYAVFAVLALYLNKTLAFPAAQAAGLSGLFGGAVWVMAIFGGALADRIGFRRALLSAYLILTIAYFLVGSIGAAWMAPVRSAVPLGLLAGVILFLPALGVALVKPSV